MALELGGSQVQAQLERFAKLPRPYRIAAMPLLVALVVGLYVYLFFLPARAQLGVIEGKER